MPKIVDDVNEAYVRKPDYWSKFIVLLIIGLNILFVLEILDIFRTMESEPYALIGLVSAVSVGQYSIIYFVLKKGETIVRESIRYDRDYEMISGGRAHEAKMATDKQEHDVKMAVDKRTHEHHMEPGHEDHLGPNEEIDVEFCSSEEIGMVDDLDDIFKDKEE